MINKTTQIQLDFIIVKLDFYRKQMGFFFLQIFVYGEGEGLERWPIKNRTQPLGGVKIKLIRIG